MSTDPTKKKDEHVSTSQALDDEQRVKVLSPGMLVAKRFFRNKLAVAGLVILVAMFLFSFIGGMVSPYNESQVFRKTDHVWKDYAGATYNKSYIFTTANGAEFPAQGQQKFILATNKGNDSFEANDVTYGLEQKGEDYWAIYSSESVATVLTLKGKSTYKQAGNIEITDVTIEDLEKMNQNDLSNYLFFLDNTLENISKTRNRKLASMKRLYEYLETNNLINVNPTKWMESATIEKRQPKYLDLNESKRLLANTISSDCRYKIRNYAITCVFLNCGLRLSELVGINLSDLKIDNSEQTLKVTGKGNKQRIIYLNSAVCEAINAYIKIRPKLDKSNKDYNALFLSSRGKRISKRSVQNIIKSELVELVEAEGKESKKYHTHTLRHTGATLLYNEANANIFVLKIILGHESLDATQVYTHVSDKKLKELMQNFNILDRKE